MTITISERISLPGYASFHHIGYATRNLARERNFFMHLGYEQIGDNFMDYEQGVLGCFLEGPGPRLELLENLPKSNTLTPWLNAGIAMYHFAYEVENLEQAAVWADSQRARKLIDPVPAVAFGGRRICFYMFREGPMLEFIEL